MTSNLKDTIDILKEKVQSNLKLIDQNESQIFKILKEPVSANRTRKLKSEFDKNKKLLAENYDTKSLQESLVEYLRQYHKETYDFVTNGVKKEKPSKSEHISDFVKLDKDDYFKLTIDGVVEFNKLHPYYNDEEFLNNLINFHATNENYELCSEFMKQKNMVSKNF